MMVETKAVGERLGVRVRVDLDRRLDGAVAVGAHKMSMLQDLEAGVRSKSSRWSASCRNWAA